jgi:hypothetical protein
MERNELPQLPQFAANRAALSVIFRLVAAIPDAADLEPAIQ